MPYLLPARQAWGALWGNGMIRFIFRTDVHVADHSPASWKGDYPEEIWESLRQVGELAYKHKVTAVLDGGDYFHVKAPTRNSHRLVAKSAWVQSGYPCPTYSIEGNHDIKHNNLETIDEQPLGVLFEAGVFQQLRNETFEAEGVRVRVVGCPYDATRTLADLRAVQKDSNDDHLVAVVHALAGEMPPDHVEEFFGEPVFRYEDLVTENGPDVWMFGHWHKDQGVTHIRGKTFVNLGALSRGALVKENLTRIPKVALLEFRKGGFDVTPIELDVAPASEVFDLEKKERRDRETRSIEQFVDRMKAGLEVPRGVSIEDAVGQISGFADEIGALAVEYLRRARGEA